MSVYKLGFIGAGNMAAAIIKGAIKKAVAVPEYLNVFDVDTKKVKELEELGIKGAISVEELCANSDIILLAVKPSVMPTVLESIKSLLSTKPVVSIAAGWSADRIKSVIGLNQKVLCLMPNTPLMVGEGMSVIETPHNLSAEEAGFIENVFSSIGEIEYVNGKVMAGVTAVSGSGPAYVFMFIEALADAGVLYGLTRPQAIKLAAQTVLGSAKMVLETGNHPGALKDAVCSPSGTTIEAVKSLENDGMRAAVMNAAEKCAKKFMEMSKA